MTKGEATKIMEAFALLHKPVGIEKVDEAIQVLFLKDENRMVCATCNHYDAVCKIDDIFISKPEEYSCGAHSLRVKK